MNKNVESLKNQFLNQNRGILPELVKLFKDIKDEFLEIKAEQGLVTAVLTTYHTIDTLTDDFSKNKQPISCHACKSAYCCHQSIEICEAEASVIAQYCNENGIIIPRKYLKKQLAYSRESVAYSSCSACVFLKDNKCSIYYVRPAACRTYFVATKEELCDMKKYRNHQVAHVANTTAEMIKMAMMHEGGNVDRMPSALLKYSK